MKSILLISFVLFFCTNLFAQESEFTKIETTLDYYLDGGTNNDFETLKKAFHSTATMKFVGEEYKEVNAIDFFKKGIKPGPKQERKTRITSINITGNAATAQLEIEYQTFTFIDYMSLLKIDGQWKIVSKIFYKRMRNEGE
ncbi:nuclear transport factor 2 family protein [Pontimicrobium sp. SW4]|uniref:Nuclear transport factor 2 family protein n=1 Tax=Pontimicrobium sp. SW4 TaxID=3153519 RepID=A0AAU7BUF4_9FLAO